MHSFATLTNTATTLKYFNYRKVKEELKRIKYLNDIRGARSNIRVKFILYTIASVGAAILAAHLLKSTSLPQEAILMAAIFVLAALLWVTEALPLFATALVVITLEIILIANPGNWVGLGAVDGNNPDYKTFLSPISNPIIILFLGGFILAQASVKEGIDKALASNLLKVFGNKPQTVMLGLMVITAIFSMWMSNTATTAMMITLAVPLMSQISEQDPFRKALVLCIPFAANIGGLGTPIASPPNAVAVGFLKNVGIDISFLEWMMVAVPLVIAMLIVAWWLLWMLYKPKKTVCLSTQTHKIDSRGWYVMAVFSLTIVLWLTDAWHGLPTAVVALVPVVGFTTTGIIRRSDFNALEWHILFLIAGGIALGMGLKITALDVAIVDLIPKESGIIFPLLIVSTVLLSTFMSNTAASNLLVPLGISFAIGLENQHLAMEIGVGIAFAASMAMSLPISTPPNAIAYAKGVLSSSDFVKAGIVIGVIAIALILGGRWMLNLVF